MGAGDRAPLREAPPDFGMPDFVTAVKVRQFYDPGSSTYSYLLHRPGGSRAVVIDPTEAGVSLMLQTAGEMGVTIRLSLETHVHADHVTGAHQLREETGCRILVGRESGLACASGFFSDGDRIGEDGLSLTALYTPGHTDDSYCFLGSGCLFTGDTLLIRGTGRTDFQNGDPRAAYRSLLTKVLVLEDETVVFPGHDYRGMTSSTIGEERRHNPRLQVRDAEEYAALMSALRPPPPQRLDEAVSRNRRCGAP